MGTQCLFILVQGSGSFSNPVSDPQQALGKEQGAAWPWRAEEFRGQALAGLQ